MKRLLALLPLVALLDACGPYVPPPVPTAPAPTIREVQLTVWTPVDPTAMLTIDGTSTHAAWTADCSSTRLDDKGVKVICRLPVDAPAPFGTHLRIWADGFDPVPIDFATIDFPLSGPVSVQEIAGVELKPSFVPLPRLVRKGDVFGLDNGQRFSAIDHTSFALLYRELLEGDEAIDDTLRQNEQDIGFNMNRVLLMCHGMFHLYPDEYTPQQYDAAFLAMAKHAAKRHQYINAVVFADATFAMPDLARQIAFWNHVGDLARQAGNVILSAVNESDQTINELVSLDDLGFIPGVLVSRGSNGGTYAVPPRPPLDWEEVHLNGQSEWWRKSHNAMELSEGTDGITASHVPAMVTEENRCDDQDGNPQHYFDNAAIGTLLTAGAGTFHSSSSRYSQVLAGVELACAKAHVAGALSVPLRCQDGLYVHLEGAEGATWLRLYQHGTDPACIAGAHP